MKAIKQTVSERGFTIVELLIVVVVIAILAAITIVSYNGITNRANASAAQSSAATVQKKLETYNAELSTYPSSISALTGATADKSYYLTGVTIAGTVGNANEFSTAPTSANGKSAIQLVPCGVIASGTTAPTTQTLVSVYTGAQIRYFNYTAGSGTTTVNVGQTSGTFTVGAENRNVACPTSA